MKKRNRILATAVTFALGTAMMAAMPVCAEDEQDGIVICIGSQSCDGKNDPTQQTNRAYSFFYSTLMTYDNEMNLINDLAKDYEVSEDGRTYTFHLRDDVKFSDGSDFTAKDVVFTYEKTKEVGAAVDLTSMESVTAVDDYTVEFVLSSPNSLFLTNTAFLGIVSADLWNENYGQNPIGTGKYKLVQLDQDQQMILEANEFYYGTKPSIEKITVLALSDDVVLSAIQAGTVDLACVPTTQAGMEIEGYEILACDTNVTKFLNLQVIEAGTNAEGVAIGSDVTSDIAVREAITIGINRQEIVDDVMNGYGEPAYYLFENMAWSNMDPGYEDGQIEKACQILEEAGWVDEDGDGIREKDGVKASLNVNGSADETERYNIAVAVAQQLKEIGIEMNVTSKAWADCRAEALSVPTVWSVGNYNPVDIRNYGYSELGGVSWYNPSFYANEKVDEYINAAVAAVPSEANEYWKKAQYDGETGINVEYAYLPVILAQETYYVSDKLSVGEQRVHDHGMGGKAIIYNVEEWTVNE